MIHARSFERLSQSETELPLLRIVEDAYRSEHESKYTDLLTYFVHGPENAGVLCLLYALAPF